MASKKKQKSVILTCAPTGGIHTPTMSPHLPITPRQIADEAIAAAEAGASVIHLHARDPETGKPDPSAARFMEFLPIIKQSTDAVVNISTGGGLGMTREERLRAAMRASPEMASLNVGSLNFGLFPLLEKYKDWKHDWEPQFLEMTKDFIFKNTFADIEYILKELGDGHGTRFEFECYDLGHLYNLAWFVDQGLVKPPFFVQMVFGIMGGMGADLDNLMHLHKKADALFGDDYEWSVLAAGRNQMPFATQAAMLGGNLRVGLEDSLYIGRGELAESNAHQVSKIRRIVEELGLSLATPAEARERLALKGGDQVGF
ncbi:MAG: 3-keto-5-aminohexanoate cleavage protein [Marivibrio sp.]|uniref:3-keto-5-aminohexanoate cleavage protein n=1 Tax=Marivibrio sp. TaxID=2039719 RepID=UPI0032EADFD9